MHLFLNILAFASIGLFANGEEWCMSQFGLGYRYKNGRPFQAGIAASHDECMNRCLNNPMCFSSEYQHKNGGCFSFSTLFEKTHYMETYLISDVAFKVPKKNGVCGPGQVRIGDTVTQPNGKKYTLTEKNSNLWEVKEV